MNFTLAAADMARSDCHQYEITFAPLHRGEWCNCYYVLEGIRQHIGADDSREKAKQICIAHERKHSKPPVLNDQQTQQESAT